MGERGNALSDGFVRRLSRMLQWWEHTPHNDRQHQQPPSQILGSVFRLAWATTTAEWTTSTTSWTVTSIKPFIGVYTGDNPLSVTNPQGLVAASGQGGLIGYGLDPDSGALSWQAISFKGLQRTVVTANQYDSTTHAFQNKTISAYLQTAGAESTWNTIKALAARSLVTDVEDATTHLTHDKRDIYIVEEGSESTDNIVEIDDECP